MSSEFEGKSSEDIINEQQASLDSKSAHGGQFSYKTASSVDESGVDDGAVSDFPSLAGQPQVSVGRTGQTGGGENAQWIPESEGGASGTGNSSNVFEHSSTDDDQRTSAARNNPGGVSLKGDAIDARSVQSEAIRSYDAPQDGQPQL